MARVKGALLITLLRVETMNPIEASIVIVEGLIRAAVDPEVRNILVARLARLDQELAEASYVS